MDFLRSEGVSPSFSSPAPSNDDIEAVIQMATSTRAPDGRLAPLKDTRTQLFVGNLPYRVRWQDLKDLFRKAGTVLRADVSLGPDNRSRGYGTVLLASAEDAGRAVDMFNGYAWQTRILEVRPDRLPPDFDSLVPPGMASSSPAGGASIASLMSAEMDLKYYGPGSNVDPLRAEAGRNVFVGNLPFHCQWQDLKDLFRQAGTTIRADVALGPDGRSRGFGTVVFATEYDAERAVKMFNGFEYSGRTLKVHFDKYPVPPNMPGSGSLTTPASPVLASAPSSTSPFRPMSSSLAMKNPSLLGMSDSSSFMNQTMGHSLSQPSHGLSHSLSHNQLRSQSQDSHPMQSGLSMPRPTHPGPIVVPSGYHLEYDSSSAPASPGFEFPYSVYGLGQGQPARSRHPSGASGSGMMNQAQPLSGYGGHGKRSSSEREMDATQLANMMLGLNVASKLEEKSPVPAHAQPPPSATAVLKQSHSASSASTDSSTSSKQSSASPSTSSMAAESSRRTTPASDSERDQSSSSSGTESAQPKPSSAGSQHHPHHPGPITIPPPAPIPMAQYSMPHMSPGFAVPISPMGMMMYHPGGSPMHHPMHGGMVPMTPHGLPPITPSMPPFTFATGHVMPSPTAASFAAATAVGVGMAVLSPDASEGVGGVMYGHHHQQHMPPAYLYEQQQRQYEQLRRQQDQERETQSGAAPAPPEGSAPTSSHPNSIPPSSHPPMPSAAAAMAMSAGGPMLTPFSPGLVMSPGAFYGRAGTGGPEGGINAAVGAPVRMVPLHHPMQQMQMQQMQNLGMGTPTYFGVPSPGSTINGVSGGGQPAMNATGEPSGYFDTYFAGFGGSPPPAVATQSDSNSAPSSAEDSGGEQKPQAEQSSAVEDAVMKNQAEKDLDRRKRDGGEDHRVWEGRADEHEDTVDDVDGDDEFGPGKTSRTQSLSNNSSGGQSDKPTIARSDSAPDVAKA